MDNKFFTVTSPKSPRVTVEVFEGHFVTSSAHRSHYINIFELMASSAVARDAARDLASPYRANTSIDAIVCMDKTEILAAYMADELLQAGINVMNEGSEILLLTPRLNSRGQFMFNRNVQERIKGKDVLLLVALLSTGATVAQMQECLKYYGCNLAGISAVFSAFPEVNGYEIHSLFDSTDIPDYHFYKPSECVMCKEGIKVDANISSEGFTRV